VNALAMSHPVRSTAEPPRSPTTAISPLMTVASVLIDVLGIPRGTPVDWLRAARGSQDGVHLSALAPVFSRSARPALPDCLLPRPAAGVNVFTEELARIATTPVDVIVEQLAADALTSAGWQLVIRNPQRWRDVYCNALERVWTELHPAWVRVADQLEAELGEIAPALVVDRLSPCALAPIARLGLGEHPVADACVFTPLLGGPRAGFVQIVDGLITYVAYPSPATTAATGGPAPHEAPGDLAQLLGEPRSQLLCRVARPKSAGDLATDLMLAPSVVSHHLTFLERAGLVRRERTGRNVFVRRTERADALIQIYATK
jgi:hypothetical protein